MSNDVIYFETEVSMLQLVSFDFNIVVLMFDFICWVCYGCLTAGKHSCDGTRSMV